MFENNSKRSDPDFWSQESKEKKEEEFCDLEHCLKQYIIMMMILTLFSLCTAVAPTQFSQSSLAVRLPEERIVKELRAV